MEVNRPVQVVSPAPRDIWNAIVGASSEVWLSQTPAWLDCVCAVGGYEDASCLYEMSGNRYLVLPMARRHVPVSGQLIVESMPHGWGIGGPLAADPISVDDVALVWGDLINRAALYASIRPSPLCSDIWASTCPPQVRAATNSTHILDLSGGVDHVWEHRFKSTTRTKIRKAEHMGLRIECDSSTRLVPVFYDLYLQWVERRAREQGIPLWLARWRGKRWDPYNRIHSIVEHMGDACRVWVAWCDDRPAAAIITLFYKDKALFWRGTSDKELATGTRANDFLQWLAIQEACRAGCRHYGMGESGGVASLMRYKSGFGAVLYPYIDYNLGWFPTTEVSTCFQSALSVLK
ncbi:MAG: GNAT family N-acetyltransferase, partial [Anaerolineae bacterium]|nr:GNAT family N-acetyltransferase [Anaerolineae bacterium]